MADVSQGTITASWNGVGTAPAGSVVQLPGFSYKPITMGTSREDATLGIGISGTWSATLQFEGSIDGVNYFAIAAFPAVGITQVHQTSTTANGNFLCNTEGLRAVRVRCSSFTSGTATVDLVSAIAGLSVASSGSPVGPYNYTNITATGGTLIKTGQGLLHSIVINAPNAAAATINVDDAVSDTTPRIAIITTVASATVVTPPYIYDVAFTNGLFIQVNTTALNLTVAWK